MKRWPSRAPPHRKRRFQACRRPTRGQGPAERPRRAARRACHAEFERLAPDMTPEALWQAVLADAGRIDEAVDWLQQALAGGNLNFLRVACAALLNATHPKIRELAQAYQRRAAQLADERDGEQLADLA